SQVWRSQNQRGSAVGCPRASAECLGDEGLTFETAPSHRAQGRTQCSSSSARSSRSPRCGSRWSRTETYAERPAPLPSAGGAMAAIQLEQVSKAYPGGVQAVREVDLEIGSGEFMVLVGPSGCGKSTLLRMIAGLEEVTSGSIRIGDRDVTN